MISLATPLVFANQPAQGSPYPPERPLDLEPNSGTFRLSQNDRVNFAFLEQENRLRELLGGAHLLPPCARKDELEETIFQELERCNTIKRDHWNHQRMHVDKNQVVHLKDWLGRLLSRPGIEDILDDYPTAASRLTQEGKMSDIWSSPEIIGLKGSDGKLFFGPDRPKGEARYLFSFAVDGFNPFQNKTAKQKVTSTGFWAILLNFPPNFRHLFENMCLLGAGP
ncbi:hypothetical protein DFH06DRAFT_1013702, partial [Mycena polygramma]